MTKKEFVNKYMDLIDEGNFVKLHYALGQEFWGNGKIREEMKKFFISCGIDPQCIDGYSELPTNMLSSMDIETYVIPNGITAIGPSCFYECNKLIRVKIPSTVTYIGSRAFYKCTRLESIIFNGTVEQWKSINMENNIFNGVPTSVVRCTDGVTRTQ